ncbi:MAG TPA: alginate export family protein, partial [Spirochaetota bacterium]|nr:alginate export family protein [Spirochaetota bacterium]
NNNERERLNNLRKSSVIAGRIFSGFTFQLMQVYNQNFSLSFLANIDLIPYDFIVTYPSIKSAVNNTFSGRYSSFYVTFNANGKIIKGLYYNFEATYETGFNTCYNDSGESIKINDSLINSFAINTGLNYFFDHKTKPMFGFKFMYANGDNDVLFNSSAIINKEGDDNNYRSPMQPSIGYALGPDFSNVIVITLNNSIKPLIFLKNEIFSRFLLESGLLLLLRPNINGATFYKERFEYLKGDKRSSYEKAYLGLEIDLSASWQIFSDLSFQLQGGVLIPNYTIYDGNDVFWKVGLSLNVSF